MAEQKVDDSRWQVLFAHPPAVAAVSEDCFEISSFPESDITRELADGEVLVKLTHVSVDPYMRGKMNTASYTGDVWHVGQACNGIVGGVIVKSKFPALQVGDKVTSLLPWKAQVIAPGAMLMKNPNQTVSTSLFLGGLGMPGLSAYLPFQKFSKIKGGEVVFVSGAAGAVGSIFGQLCKSVGCTVYGSAGSDDKLKVLKDLGFDDSTNYKKEAIATGLDRMLAGKKIDVYFDNVGGETLDEVFPRMAVGGRIICCGMISQYNLTPEQRFGLKNSMSIVTSRLTLNGFIVSDWMDEWGKATVELVELCSAGKIKPIETIVEGHQNIPKTFVALFGGENTGKMVVKVAD
eukprot:TRINITY_DN866_c0_g2_i1.p1 TRINITY_DN866_c0_g2~~TRINITY_DN866_c0_g2_i1.p1  ORF type:complete len:347 (+),score=122.33 TRINITY_DN866_c0_g2_i1:327-1367(+)